MLKPLSDNVLVEVVEQVAKTASGIYLPDTASKEKPQTGKVVAVGDGRLMDNGTVVKVDDAIRAVKLITGVMANSICEANGGTMVDYVSDSKEDSNEIMQKAVDSVKKKEDRPKKEFKEEVKEVKAVTDLSSKTVSELRELAKEKEHGGEPF